MRAQVGKWIGQSEWCFVQRALSNREGTEGSAKRRLQLTYSETSSPAHALSWRYFFTKCTFKVWNLLPKDTVDARLARVVLDELCWRQESWIDGSLF